MKEVWQVFKAVPKSLDFIENNFWYDCLSFHRYSIQRRHLTQFRKAKTEMVILILKFFLQFFPSFLLYLSVLIIGDDPDVDLSTWANLILISSSALLGPFLNQTIRSKTLKGCRIFLCSNPNEVVVVAWKFAMTLKHFLGQIFGRS